MFNSHYQWKLSFQHTNTAADFQASKWFGNDQIVPLGLVVGGGEENHRIPDRTLARVGALPMPHLVPLLEHLKVLLVEGKGLVGSVSFVVVVAFDRLQRARVDFPVNSPKFQQELVYKLVPTGTGHLEFPAEEIIVFLCFCFLTLKLQMDVSNNLKTRKKNNKTKPNNQAEQTSMALNVNERRKPRRKPTVNQNQKNQSNQPQ